MKKLFLLSLWLVPFLVFGQGITFSTTGYFPGNVTAGGQFIGNLAGGTNFTGSVTKVAASNSPDKSGAAYICPGTNDQYIIQVAISNTPSTGGKVLLLPGQFNVTGSIHSKYGLWLQGSGQSTVIKYFGAGAGDNIFAIYSRNGLYPDVDSTSASYVTVSDLVLDGNAKQISHIVLQGYDGYAQDPNIINVTIQNSAGASVYGLFGLAHVRNLLVRGCRFASCGDSLIELRGTDKASIINNSFGTGAVQMYTDSDNILFADNLMENTVFTTTYQTKSLRGLIFANNVARRTTSTASVSLNNVVDLVVCGNILDGASQTSGFSATTSFLSLYNGTKSVKNALLCNNIITFPDSAATYGYNGIYSDGGENIRISGNQIYLGGITNSTGIKILTGPFTNLVVSGNAISELTGNQKQVGISLASVTNAFVLQNSLANLGIGINILSTATNTAVLGNTFLNTATNITDAGITTYTNYNYP